MISYEIETERLYLRHLTLDDIEDLLVIFQDPIAMKYYKSTKDEEEAKNWIIWNLINYQNHGHGLYAVIDKQTNAFLGQTGLVPQIVDEQEEVEVGYLFKREYWKKGYATEAALGCVEYAKKNGKERLISIIDPKNEPSIQVAKRIGMVHEKDVIKWDRSCSIYALNLVLK